PGNPRKPGARPARRRPRPRRPGRLPRPRRVPLHRDPPGAGGGRGVRAGGRDPGGPGGARPRVGDAAARPRGCSRLAQRRPQRAAATRAAATRALRAAPEAGGRRVRAGPGNEETRRALAAPHATLALVLAPLGRPGEARAACRAALLVREPLARAHPEAPRPAI